MGGQQPPSPLRGERSRPSPGLPLPTRHCGGRTDGRGGGGGPGTPSHPPEGVRVHGGGEGATHTLQQTPPLRRHLGAGATSFPPALLLQSRRVRRIERPLLKSPPFLLAPPTRLRMPTPLTPPRLAQWARAAGCARAQGGGRNFPPRPLRLRPPR